VIVAGTHVACVISIGIYHGTSTTARHGFAALQ